MTHFAIVFHAQQLSVIMAKVSLTYLCMRVRVVHICGSLIGLEFTAFFLFYFDGGAGGEER